MTGVQTCALPISSQEIITKGGYELYEKESDKGVNFYKMLMDKTLNKEAIDVYKRQLFNRLCFNRFPPLPYYKSDL